MTPIPPRGKWFRLKHLPLREQWLLLEAFFLLPLNKTALRFVGYRRWQKLLCVSLPRNQKPYRSAKVDLRLQPNRIAQLVHAVGREGFFTGTCLERAFTLWWLLRRRHFAAELQLGGRQHAGRFEAHAWVELDGAVLNEGDTVIQYVPFENLSAITKGKS